MAAEEAEVTVVAGVTTREADLITITVKNLMIGPTKSRTEIMKKNGIIQMLSIKIERSTDTELKKRRMKMI